MGLGLCGQLLAFFLSPFVRAPDVPFLGYLPSERKQPVVNRAKDAVRDDHAVMALRKHTSDLLKLKDLVEQVIQAR